MHAHRGISRRRMLELAAGGVALVGGVQTAWTQAKRIEQLDPALDAIIDKAQPIQELATGYGGDLGPAEGPLWWKEGGYLLFNDINASRRLKYTPGKGVTVDLEGTNRANGLTRDLQGRLLSCEHDTRRVTRRVSCSHAIRRPFVSRVRPLARFDGSRSTVTPRPGVYFMRRLLWMSLNRR